MKASHRYAAVSWLGRHPSLFRIYYGLHPGYRHLLVQPDYEVVIEGYPRCANSFSVLAFERAQQHRMRIGHHLHAPAQVELGVRYGLPVLVLIREPLGAAASLIARHPEITAVQALRQYISFYECVQSHVDSITLADFCKITSDYAQVISGLNSKFSTNFMPYFNTPEEDAAVFAEIDFLNIRNEGGAGHQLARPSEAKKAILNSARDQIERETLLHRARTVFDQLLPNCV